MKLSSKAVKVLALFLFGLTITGLAWANGEEFFTPDTSVKSYFYYFGHVKDKSGKVLDDVLITITVKDTPLKFVIRNDTPGHFRTPDIGRAIVDYGQQTINPASIEVTATKQGYRQISPATSAAPKGIVNGVDIEFVMEQVASK